MIVPMAKVTAIGCTAWQHELLLAIRKAGAVHLLPPASPGKDIRENDRIEAEREINLLEDAIALMPDSTGNTPCPNGLACAEEILAIHTRQKALKKEIVHLEAEYDSLQLWGRFSPELLSRVSEALPLRFFLATPHDLKTISATTCVYQIGRQDSRLLLVIIGLEHAVDGLQEVTAPARGMTTIADLLVERKKTLAADDLKRHAIEQYHLTLLRTLHNKKEQLALIRAERSMTCRDDLSYIQGFCPDSSLAGLREAATRQKCVLLLENPEENDPVPTLLRYSAWTRLFAPIMSFIGVLPGYREFDTNAPSLFFFIIFFAMLIGDAGYGLLLFLTGLFYCYRSSKKEFSWLLIILSIATMFWGACTGNWFGVAGLEKTSFLGQMVLPALAASNPQNAAAVIQLCFGIGASQLILAHLWQTVRQFPGLTTLADIGWCLLIGAIYFILLLLVLDQPMPRLTIYLLSSGIVLIILFGEQAKTFSLRAVGHALARSPLTLLNGINTLSDLVSYIRLFAVGLATREVALAVNHLAFETGFETVFSTLAAVAILLAGHGLNITLGAMAILVHGIRLNLLEFSRHLKINWSGIPYTPFAKKGL